MIKFNIYVKKKFKNIFNSEINHFIQYLKKKN